MAEPARSLMLPERGDARSWPAQGQWTYADYRQLPEDGRRYEVIRGHLYASPAPSIDHQRVVTRLLLRFGRFVDEHRIGEVFSAPLDVLLPRGIATPVEPDLMFFRTGNKPRAGTPNFEGVPDLVVEVLSPSTRRLDTRVKLAAYRDAGVPEVWHADPQERTIAVFGLSEDGTTYLEVSCGPAGDSITLRLLPGFRIDVSEIFAPEPA